MSRRGPHPQDSADLGADAVPALRRAAAELSALLGRGYADRAALTLVGDRFQLGRRQRHAVLRAAAAPPTRRARVRSRVDDLEGRDVVIDGFNTLIVLERAWGGGPLLRGVDGAYRDLGAVHGTYRPVDDTDAVIDAVAAALVDAGARSVRWVLDAPVSNSGRLANRLRARAPAGLPWAVDVVRDADTALVDAGAVVATGDGGVLDRGVAWTDLVGRVLPTAPAPPWVVDLAPHPPAPRPLGAATPAPERLVALDRRLVEIAKRIRVLDPLSFPRSTEERFLTAFEAGRPELPRHVFHAIEHADARAALVALLDDIDPEHPAGAFLARTAGAYVDAIDLLAAAGTPALTERSAALYGLPTDPLAPGAPSSLEAAEHFTALCPDLEAPQGPERDAADAAEWLAERLEKAFADPPRVEVSEELSALATAGSQRIRLRAHTTYTELQLRQFLEHEALVHSATKRNGRAQPVLSALGLSAPRTTGVQEGLATLAEMITDVMDVQRLRRIALRVRAVQAALDGADFIEVFRLFLDAGQAPRESYHSAARVFRGATVRGRVAFTKDVVYVGGLLRVHTFLLKAIQAGRRELPARLFVGRLTPGDVLALDEAFDSGLVAPARDLPDWVASTECLAAYLSWAAFNDRITLDAFDLDAFRDD